MAAFNYEQVIAAVERDDNTGICVLCGHEQGNTEPDARKYACENCERKSVFGAEELLSRFPI
jgi:succinyl-CoA synthetase alpha subunit